MRLNPYDVAIATLAFAAFLAVMVGFMAAFPDAIPSYGVTR